jgi:hypothetical protein
MLKEFHEPLRREQKILFRVDKAMKILEIGPSFSPIAPKSEGWNSWTVDHATEDELKQKYDSHPGVDVNKIECVDFVWGSGDLVDVIPAEYHATFDACIASHVIEHLPNPVRFYQSLQRLVQPDGFLSLAIPDKRFCFDFFKPFSTTGDLLYADERNSARHSKRALFDHNAYAVRSNESIAWGQHAVTNLSFFVSLADAKRAFESADETEAAPYVDCHGWCYTPSSFKLVILELGVIDAIDWVMDIDFPSEGCEFYVTLKRGRPRFESDAQLQQKRIELLKSILLELKVQCDYLIAGEVETDRIGDSGTAKSCPFPIEAAAEELIRRMVAVDGRQAEMMRAIQDQDARIRKIYEVAQVVRKLFRPFRAIGRGPKASRTRPN